MVLTSLFFFFQILLFTVTRMGDCTGWVLGPGSCSGNVTDGGPGRHTLHSPQLLGELSSPTGIGFLSPHQRENSHRVETTPEKFLNYPIKTWRISLSASSRALARVSTDHSLSGGPPVERVALHLGVTLREKFVPDLCSARWDAYLWEGHGDEWQRRLRFPPHSHIFWAHTPGEKERPDSSAGMGFYLSLPLS